MTSTFDYPLPTNKTFWSTFFQTLCPVSGWLQLWTVAYIKCLIKTFRNQIVLYFILKTIVTLFYLLRCITRCHSFPLVVQLVAIRCTTRCQSLHYSFLFAVTRCHSMYHSSVFLWTIVELPFIYDQKDIKWLFFCCEWNLQNEY